MARLTLVLRCCRGLRSHGRPHKHTVLPAESLVDQRDTFSRRKKCSLEALTPSPSAETPSHKWKDVLCVVSLLKGLMRKRQI